MKLADMADLSQRRLNAIYLVVSSAIFFLFTLYACVNLIKGNHFVASSNIVCAILSLFNVWQIKRHPQSRYPTLCVTLALLIDTTRNILHLGTTETQTFWIFPAMAALIYLNKFKIGVGLTVIYSLITAAVLSVGGDFSSQVNLSALVENRIFIAFVTNCTVCLISNYFFYKTLNYIQELYQSGIQELAYKDKLTGLANRWSFESWANTTLEEERLSKNITALVFLDIDNFKTINDNYGHDIGDKLLQDFAKRLSNSIRHTNRKTNEYEYSIARYAGDEFMLLLHDVPDMQTLENIVRRINNLFAADFVEEQVTEPLTFSIGVAVFKKDAEKLEDLIRCADRAMYDAKREGKNCYQFYQSVEEISATLPSESNPSLKLHLV